MNKSECIALADEIDSFLQAHGVKDADGIEWNGPDPYALVVAAECLRRGEVPSVPFSEWGSGCYRPYADKAAQARHAAILQSIRDLRLGVVPKAESSSLSRKRIISYRWKRCDGQPIPEDHVEALDETAEARITEMRKEGFSSGELSDHIKMLPEDPEDGVEYKGWWEVTSPE